MVDKPIKRPDLGGVTLGGGLISHQKKNGGSFWMMIFTLSLKSGGSVLPTYMVA